MLPKIGGKGGSLTAEQSAVLDRMELDVDSNTIIVDATVKSGPNSLKIGDVSKISAGMSELVYLNTKSGIQSVPIELKYPNQFIDPTFQLPSIPNPGNFSTAEPNLGLGTNSEERVFSLTQTATEVTDIFGVAFYVGKGGRLEAGDILFLEVVYTDEPDLIAYRKIMEVPAGGISVANEVIFEFDAFARVPKDVEFTANMYIANNIRGLNRTALSVQVSTAVIPYIRIYYRTIASTAIATQDMIYKALLGEVPGSNVKGDVEYYANLSGSATTGDVYRVLKRTANYWTLGMTARHVAGFYEKTATGWDLLSNAATPVFDSTDDDNATQNYRMFTPYDINTIVQSQAKSRFSLTLPVGAGGTQVELEEGMTYIFPDGGSTVENTYRLPDGGTLPIRFVSTGRQAFQSYEFSPTSKAFINNETATEYKGVLTFDRFNFITAEEFIKADCNLNVVIKDSYIKIRTGSFTMISNTIGDISLTVVRSTLDSSDGKIFDLMAKGTQGRVVVTGNTLITDANIMNYTTTSVAMTPKMLNISDNICDMDWGYILYLYTGTDRVMPSSLDVSNNQINFKSATTLTAGPVRCEEDVNWLGTRIRGNKARITDYSEGRMHTTYPNADATNSKQPEKWKDYTVDTAQLDMGEVVQQASGWLLNSTRPDYLFTVKKSGFHWVKSSISARVETSAGSRYVAMITYLGSTEISRIMFGIPWLGTPASYGDGSSEKLVFLYKDDIIKMTFSSSDSLSESRWAFGSVMLANPEEYR